MVFVDSTCPCCGGCGEAALLPELHYLPNSKAHDWERGLSNRYSAWRIYKITEGNEKPDISAIYGPSGESFGKSRTKDNGWELSPACIFNITGCHRVACFDQPCGYLNTGLSLSVVRREPHWCWAGPQEKANKDVIIADFVLLSVSEG